MFAAFVLLPTRSWPRTDRELPFLAIALYVRFSVESRLSRYHFKYVKDLVLNAVYLGNSMVPCKVCIGFSGKCRSSRKQSGTMYNMYKI